MSQTGLRPMDVHDKKTRSYNMSMIRSKDTVPEIKVRRYLFSLGYRYRLNVKKLPGKPDIVLEKHKMVIFVNGCFWHGHADCKYFRIPKTRTEWWRNKIEGNMVKDALITEALRNLGYRVVVIWECEVKNGSFRQKLEQGFVYNAE